MFLYIRIPIHLFRDLHVNMGHIKFQIDPDDIRGNHNCQHELRHR